MKTIIYFLMLICVSLPVAAEEGRKPINVLLIGNSQCPAIVSNQLLEKLAGSDKDARPIKVTGCIRGGASLHSHWDAGTGPDTARGKIASGSFDFVVLQDIYFVEEAELVTAGPCAVARRESLADGDAAFSANRIMSLATTGPDHTVTC